MTNLFTRAYCDRAAIAQGQPGTPIRFIASTENVARDGMVIESSAWRLDHYNANPVFLWAHDYSQPPIGKATASVENGALMTDVTFDQGDEFAREVERKYRDGYMNAVSVGWSTITIKPGNPPRIAEAELLDISAVPVPADPGALKERQVRGLRDLLESLDGSSEDRWPDVATAMVDVFTPGSDDDDARQAKYKALLPKYRRADKTAPEFLSLSELRALSETEISGLFLHGEMTVNQRAGAVLSARNRDDLEKARQLIADVITRATKEPKPDQMMDDDEDDDEKDMPRISEAARERLLSMRLMQAFKI